MYVLKGVEEHRSSESAFVGEQGVVLLCDMCIYVCLCVSVLYML